MIAAMASLGWSLLSRFKPPFYIQVTVVTVVIATTVRVLQVVVAVVAVDKQIVELIMTVVVE